MKRFLVVLLAVVVLFTTVLPEQEATAEGLTLAAIAGGAYAIASASGMDFSFTGYDGLGVGQWMQNRINSWLSGRTVAEAFGSDVIRLTAGKLLIPSAVVAGIVSFLDNLKTSYNLTENSTNAKLIYSNLLGLPVYPRLSSSNNVTSENIGTFTISQVSEPQIVVTETANNYEMVVYKNGSPITGSASLSKVNVDSFGSVVGRVSTYRNKLIVQLYLTYTNTSGVTVSNLTEVVVNQTEIGAVNGQIPGAYSPPEGLNDLQSWEGTVANAPDTNLDDLLDDIFDQSAAGTLDVTGQVVDTPAEPVPTSAPTAAPGTIDDVIGQLGEMSGTLEGVQEGVGEAVGQLEGINEGVGSISEALKVPTSSEAPAFKFDLTTLFPFCIPFDIYRFITMFSASPVAPHVQIPFNIPAVGLQYTFDLDFSSFDSVASVLRSVELIAFCVGLAILTSKVIRW